MPRSSGRHCAVRAIFILTCEILPTVPGGRRTFQIDLAIDIMNYELALDWDGNSDNHPDYVQKDAFTPCDCETCFFCVHGLN